MKNKPKSGTVKRLQILKHNVSKLPSTIPTIVLRRTTATPRMTETHRATTRDELLIKSAVITEHEELIPDDKTLLEWSLPQIKAACEQTGTNFAVVLCKEEAELVQAVDKLEIEIPSH